MTNAVEMPISRGEFVCPPGRAAAVRHMLVCLDRSAAAHTCLPYARFIADAFEAKITLLHVMPSPPVTQEPNRTDALEWEIAKREAEQYLSDAESSLGGPSETLTHQIAQGDPVEQIVAVARDLHADLTILSSQGARGESAQDLGSTVQHVLASAPGSVLLTQPTSSASVPPKRILVPLDGSVRSECVLPVVVDLARLHGAEVLLVHIVTEPASTAVLSDAQDIQLARSLASRIQANAEGYLARLRERMLHEVTAVQTLVVRRGEERQALLDIASQRAADMVVLAAHGSTCNAERAFGSVASYLLAHGHLPLFVVQDVPNGRDTAHGNGNGHAHHVARAPLSARPPEGD